MSSSTQIVSALLTPVGLLGKKLRTKTEIKKLASERNLHPVVMQSFLSTAGEILTGIGGANLLTAKNSGLFGYFTTFVGLGITAAGFFLQPRLDIEPPSPINGSPPPVNVESPAKPFPSDKPISVPSPEEKPPIAPPAPSAIPQVEPIPTAEEISFQEHLERVTSWKKDVLGNLGKRDEQKAVTSLLKILNLKTGRSTELLPENHLKLREYTLELLIEIILRSDNDRTIERSIKAIFDHLEDSDSKLQYNAGIALALISNEREKALEKIPENITKDIIIRKLKSLQK